MRGGTDLAHRVSNCCETDLIGEIWGNSGDVSRDSDATECVMHFEISYVVSGAR